MTKVRRNNCLLLLYLLLFINTQAQFKNRAALEPINKTGFYSIAVTPELSSYIKVDFSDLRIIDDKGKVVPYVVRETVPKHYDTVFTRLKIIENKLIDSGKSSVLIENPRMVGVGSIALLISNNAVSRQVDISGGYDKVHWYSILENAEIDKKLTNDKDKYLAVLNMPASTYRYFKVTIYNGRKDPLHILSVGDYSTWQFKFINPFIFNPVSIFKQVDSIDGYSYIYVHDSAKYHKDFLNISFQAPRFFKRNGEVWAASHKLCIFTISADSLFSTVMPLFNEKDWLIKLYNGDNPPLPVKSVYTFKTENTITAWLDSRKTYHLEMSDSLATAPIYDLQDFKDSIPAKISEIKVGIVESIAIKAIKAPSTSFFKQQWLWIVLGVVLVVLVVFTIRLTRDMGKQA